jgi:hypothetical protein
MYRVPFEAELFSKDCIAAALQNQIMSAAPSSYFGKPTDLETVQTTPFVNWSRRNEKKLLPRPKHPRESLQENTNEKTVSFENTLLNNKEQKKNRRKKRTCSARKTTKNDLTVNSIDLQQNNINNNNNNNHNNNDNNNEKIKKKRKIINLKKKYEDDSDEVSGNDEILYDSDEKEEESISAVEEEGISELDDEENEDEYDSDVTEFNAPDTNGWVKKKRNFMVKNNGNAAMYIGKFFISKKSFTYNKPGIPYIGCISNVVCKADARDTLFFEFYKYEENKEYDKEYGYYQCNNFMGAHSHVTLMDKSHLKQSKPIGKVLFSGENLVGRHIKKQFELENGKKKFFLGTIQSFSKNLYTVKYSDDTIEEENQKTINACLRSF